MIRLTAVHKSFGAVGALHDVDLELARGRTTVLIGPSGCGKSTLLRLLVGLVRPDSGRIEIDGLELGDGTAERIRRRTGYVIQDGGLFPHLSARGNVALMARYLGWEAERVEARLRELAALTHFPVDGLDRGPAELSGGQRQRVSLMRALMLDPDLVLLDEPLGALDPLVRAELQDELRQIFRHLGKTVVLVTHDLSEAAHFADHVVLLADGRIAQQGTIDDLVHRPGSEFVRRFVNAQRSPLGAAS